MFSKRTITLAILMVLPLFVYLVLGGWALWQTGLFLETFWILPVFWIVTWIVATVWKPERPEVRLDTPLPGHFTPRDEQAMQIVRQRQERVNEYSPAQLTSLEFYLTEAQDLAKELAYHYHPDARDPVSSLTVPEVLAAARLALDDVERWVLESVPGSRMVTIRQWRWLEHAPKWTRRAQNAMWTASVLLNPANILKYATAQATVGPITEELQTELLAVVYLKFIRQLGFYLVEMNSGRLRGGADEYRRTFGAAPKVSAEMAQKSGQGMDGLRPEALTIALVGQVKAGKSSLVNALIGERVARTDVLPETAEVSRFRLPIPDSDVQLTLLDTPGYADAGATKQQKKEVKQALQESDVVLWVLDAHSPARSADRELMDELRKWYDAHPNLRPAPMLAALTHIDLLSPVMEWDPPYDWRNPHTRKEQSIHDAAEHVRELFSDSVQTVIPVCTDVERGSENSMVDELLPELMKVLKEGQTAALLRTFHQRLDQQRWNLLVKQLRSSGKQLLRAWVEERFLSGVRDEPERSTHHRDSEQSVKGS